ncbi:MAG: YIP1 family protein [bacterium]
MEPDSSEENIEVETNEVSTESMEQPAEDVRPEEPVVREMPNQPAPVVEEPAPQQATPAVQAPRATASVSGDKVSVSGYLGSLKKLFTNPTEFIKELSAKIDNTIIFVLINVAFMVLAYFITSIIGSLSAEIDITGQLFWEIIKVQFFTVISGIGFLAIVALIAFLSGKISQKQATFADNLAVSSVFSLNFLAIGVSSFFGLFYIWFPSIAQFVLLLQTVIPSLALVYSTVILIQALVELYQYSYLRAVLIYVTSSIVILFIVGQLFTSFDLYFNVDFGSVGGGISGISLVSMMNNLSF